MGGVSFALLAFGTLLFTVVLAFLLLNMTKERSELQHKIASLIDPLSGVPNRRAFLDGANRLLAQQSLDPEPLAVLLFDLDRFKTINDRLGHGTGDAVLRIFAATASRTLGRRRCVRPHRRRGVRRGDAGRRYRRGLGDCRPRAPQFRGRRRLATAADDLKPTVSVGVTLGCDPKMPVANLLAAADQALYRAKANGRNRVEGLVPAGAEEVQRGGPLAGLAERRIWRKVALRA